MKYYALFRVLRWEYICVLLYNVKVLAQFAFKGLTVLSLHGESSILCLLQKHVKLTQLYQLKERFHHFNMDVWFIKKYCKKRTLFFQSSYFCFLFLINHLLKNNYFIWINNFPLFPSSQVGQTHYPSVKLANIMRRKITVITRWGYNL